VLKQGQYERLPADADGVIRSEVFPGLWLHVPSMLAGDLAQVLRVLDQGIATQEHAEFKAVLQSRCG